MKNTNYYKLEAFDLVQLLLEKHHDHQMHGVIKLEGHMNELILKEAVKQSSKDLPHIFCKVEKKFGKEYWKQVDYSIDEVVKVVQWDLSEDQIMKVVTKATDTFKGPQLCITILRGDKNDTLCVVMNHMLCDGAGFKSYLYLICNLYNSILNKSSIKQQYNPKARGLTKLVSSMEGKKIVKTKEKYTKENIEVMLEGDESRPLIMTEKITKEEFCLIKQYAKKHGVTINDIFMTIYILSLRNIFKLPISTMTCTIDARKYLIEKNVAGLCNLAGFLTCNIDNKDMSFKEMLGQVSSSMKTEKKSESFFYEISILYKAHKYLPYIILKRVVSVKLENPPIALTNIGVLDSELLKFNDIAIKEAFVTGAIKHAPNFQIAVSTFDNEVTLSINFYSSKNDEVKIRNFLKELKTQLMYYINS